MSHRSRLMNSKYFSVLVFILSLFAFALQIAAQKAPARRAIYLFAYFKNNGEDGLHLAYSRDGLKWKALNEDKPYLTPAVSDEVLAQLLVAWKDCLKQKPEWYAGEEATRIADNVLLYQRESGGWPKNIDMAVVLSERAQAEIAKEKGHDDSLIDNGATYTQ